MSSIPFKLRTNLLSCSSAVFSSGMSLCGVFTLMCGRPAEPAVPLLLLAPLPGWSNCAVILVSSGHRLTCWLELMGAECLGWVGNAASCVLHQFRDIVRAGQANTIQARRQGMGREDMADISVRPIDSFATMLLTQRRASTSASRKILVEAAAYFGRDFTKYDLGLSESILSGAYRSNHRLSKFVPGLSADCPLCQIQEDNRHLFLQCPHHDIMRAPLGPTLQT